MSDDGTLWFIDAIDGDYVWILLGEQRHRVARALLPHAAREGTWLRLSVDVAQGEAMTEAIEERRARLLEDAPTGKLKL